MADITPAKAGDVLSSIVRRRLARLMGAPLEAVPRAVVAKQPYEDPHAGQWICIDCGRPMANNFEAWGHVSSKPKHRLAWHTSNGLEEP
jgi:hypothetical protein